MEIMFALTCIIMSLICLVLGGLSKALGSCALRRILVYGGSVGLGFAAAGGIGALVGVLQPAAAIPVTSALCVIWAWIGWNHAPIRALHGARRRRRWG